MCHMSIWRTFNLVLFVVLVCCVVVVDVEDAVVAARETPGLLS